MNPIKDDKELMEAAAQVAAYIESKRDGQGGLAFATAIGAIANHVGGRGVSKEDIKVLDAVTAVFSGEEHIAPSPEVNFVLGPKWSGNSQPPQEDE